MVRRFALLHFMDEQTVQAYDATLGRCGDDSVCARLRDFQRMHEQHAEHDMEMLRSLGGESEHVSDDLRRYMEEHMRIIEQTEDQAHALEALLLVERGNLLELEQTTKSQLPEEHARVIQEHYGHEQEHVSYIEEHMPAMVGLTHAAMGAPTTRRRSGTT
jgi:hypothetical protein